MTGAMISAIIAVSIFVGRRRGDGDHIARASVWFMANSIADAAAYVMVAAVIATERSAPEISRVLFDIDMIINTSTAPLVAGFMCACANMRRGAARRYIAVHCAIAAALIAPFAADVLGFSLIDAEIARDIAFCAGILVYFVGACVVLASRQTAVGIKISCLLFSVPSVSALALHLLDFGHLVDPVSEVLWLVSNFGVYSYLFVHRARELAESRAAIAVAQVRPHFIGNTLTNIRYLCKSDPDQCVRAVEDLTALMRDSSDAFAAAGPVTFKSELERVERYLSLEKMRFGDRLSIEYDVATDDFVCPAFCVQTLVENSIKHSRGSVAVKISTASRGSDRVITIADDGPGFDLAESGSGIGLRNTALRLMTFCGGKLEIASEKGRGTTAVITIPKRKGV